MAASQQLGKGSSLQGQRLTCTGIRTLRARRTSVLQTRAIGGKENAYDKEWKKGFFGTGYFVEGKKKPNENYLKKIEQKQLLTGVERFKLLSKLEKAGLTLSKVEELKLLSTAESLGALSLVEKALVSDPGAIAALSIPPLVGSIGVLSFFPDDNPGLLIFKYILAGVLFGGSGFFVAGAFALAALNED